MANKKIIQVKDIEVKFRVRDKLLSAVRNISFDLNEGEVLAIVGESGSGKSVVTKTLTAMIDSNGWISNGLITYNDVDSSKTIDITDIQKKLLSKKNRKTILNRIKSEKKQLLKTQKIATNLINSNNFKVIDDSITQKEAKLQKINQTNLFSKSFITNVRINLLNKKIAKLKYLQSFHNNEFYLSEQNRIQKAIEVLEFDAKKYNRLNLKQIIIAKKAINILSKKTTLTASEINFFESKINPKNNLNIIFEKLGELYNGVINNNKTIDDKEMISIKAELKSNIYPTFFNRIKASKAISNIRGKVISTIFQDPMTSLNPLLSVGFQISEVLIKHQKLSRKAAKAEAINLLDKVGIPNPEKRYKDIPGTYSGGMRQRVVIAIALACKPKVLICDEPTTALDVTIQAQILQLIKDLQKEYHFSVIFITHDLGVVASMATRIMVMYSGQIIEIGSVDEIFYDARHPYTWALLSSLPQLGVKGDKLFSIKGSPPSLLVKNKGDAFAPRNKYAMKIDYIYEPPTFQISDTHFIKSWLMDERAPKIEKPIVLQNLHDFLKQEEYGEKYD